MIFNKSTTTFLLFLAVCSVPCQGFQAPLPVTTTKFLRNNGRLRGTSEDSSVDKAFDEFLEKGKLHDAVEYAKKNPTMELSKERWSCVFDTMEDNLRQFNVEPKRGMELYPAFTKARRDMSNMYTALRELQHLKLFGAVYREPPASGSHVVTPYLMETISGISVKALTPKSNSNTNAQIAGFFLLSVVVGISLWYDWDINITILSTLIASVADRLFLNGALNDSFSRLFSPGIEKKITRHEAGHFLCAYLLGCPLEGFVLSPWDSLRDKRFRGQGVSAGTSFYDPILAEQINKSLISRSTLDRYSVIVMGGIAAEAIQYGQADGGAGDEMALVRFLESLNGSVNKDGVPAWNDVSIRNQARWGILQAVLLLKEYKPCYDALVEALERGCNLGECIYAIEKAGLENELKPMDKPLGYIVDCGEYGEWTTEKPPALQMSRAVVDEGNEMAIGAIQEKKAKVTIDKNVSLATMKEVRQMMEEKIKAIDEKLLVLEQDSP